MEPRNPLRRRENRPAQREKLDVRAVEGGLWARNPETRYYIEKKSEIFTVARSPTRDHANSDEMIRLGASELSAQAKTTLLYSQKRIIYL